MARVTIPHPLDQAKAKAVTEKAFSVYEQKLASYNPTANWVTDTRAEIGFSAKGINLTGSIELLDKQIALELEVPFFLRPFQGRAMDVVKNEIEHWIGRSDEVESDSN